MDPGQHSHRGVAQSSLWLHLRAESVRSLRVFPREPGQKIWGQHSDEGGDTHVNEELAKRLPDESRRQDRAAAD